MVVLGLLGGFGGWESRFAEVVGAASDGGYGCALVVCGWVCVVGLWVMGLWWLLVAG